MGQYTKEDVTQNIFHLRKSIRMVPIEFQLMYLYMLLNFIYTMKVENYYYTNVSNIISKLPLMYTDTVKVLRKYRNQMAHSGISFCLDTFNELCELRTELDSIAALVNVDLNWDYSLNIIKKEICINDYLQ